jgi:hypothetical protein
MMLNSRSLFISLLVAALVSLGIGQAAADVCPPVCDHCRPVSTAPSCCDDMGGASGSQQQPANAGEKRQADCEHGLFCSGNIEQSDVAAGLTAPGPELVALFSDPGQTGSSHCSVFSATTWLKAPPPGKRPALYTLNCSFLI